MNTTTRTYRLDKKLLCISGCLVLALLAGCGLIMDNSDRLDRGEQALAEGDFRAAIIDAKDVLLKEPDNLRGRLLLGRASVEAGDGPAAEKELRRAVSLGEPFANVAAGLGRALISQGKFSEALDEIPLEGLPSDEATATARLVHGDAHMGLGDAEAARDLYSSVLELTPDNLDARLGIATTHIVEGNVAQAAGAIENILQTDADNPRVWLYSGAFNASNRNFETAVANYRVATELSLEKGDSVSLLQARAGLAESLLEQGDDAAAREIVDQLVESSPDTLQTKSLVARIAYIDEDWTTAQQNLQQILQVAPDYWPAQLLLGAVHFRSGNLSQAEMYLSSAVAASPDNVRARQMLAEVWLNMRKTEDARQALAPIVSGPNPDSVSLQMAARASLGESNVDGALEYLRRSVQEEPGNADLRFQLAAVLMQTGRNDEAQAVLDAIDVSESGDTAYRRDALNAVSAMSQGQSTKALALAKKVTEDYADRFGSFNLLGTILLANRDADGARASFEQASKLEPDDLISRQYLAAIDEASGDLDSAAARYQQILQRNPEAVGAMYALGRLAFGKQDYQEAANFFRRAFDKAPKNPEYRLSLAKAERQLGNTAAAEKLLADGDEASRSHFPSAIMRGALKIDSGDLDEAMRIAKDLQQRFPDNPAAYAFEGEVYVAQDDFVRADAAYQQALAKGPVKAHVLRATAIKRQLGVAGAEQPLVDFLEARPLDNEVRLVLAESYLQTDNLGKSISTYERVVKDEPANALALNNLAWAYYLSDDPRAIETARKARDANPDNGAIVDTLGWIMVQRGELEEGERLLRQAVEMENGRAEIRYHHAVALQKLGKKAEARAVLEQALGGDEAFASKKDAEKLLGEL